MELKLPIQGLDCDVGCFDGDHIDGGNLIRNINFIKIQLNWYFQRLLEAVSDAEEEQGEESDVVWKESCSKNNLFLILEKERQKRHNYFVNYMT